MFAKHAMHVGVLLDYKDLHCTLTIDVSKTHLSASLPFMLSS
jgi:hypothetical protein